MKLDELIFNQINIRHIARHKVLPEEVEETVGGKTLTFAAKKGRIMVVGRTQSARTLAIILEKVEDGKYFVVTARDADRKERKMYQEEIYE